MSPKRSLVVYPILLVLYFYLHFYSINSTTFLFPVVSMLVYLGGTLSVIAILWAILYWLWKDAAKAGILVAVWVLLFFTYGHFYDILYLRGSTISIYVSEEQLIRSHAILLMVWALFGTSAAMLVVARGHLATRFTSALNIVTVVLCSFPVMSIIVSNTRFLGDNLVGASESSVDVLPLESTAYGYDNDALPDIYYIILDEHARADVLQDYYQYDSDFPEYLEENGFYVAYESNTNYTTTAYSLSSTLNMRYLDESDRNVVDAERNLQRMIQDNTLCRSLQEIGYTYIVMESIITGRARCADIRIDNVINNLDIIFLKTTLVRPLLNQSVWAKPTYENHLQRIEVLADISTREEPTFTFSHFILPHPPFVFDREGNLAPQEYPATAETYHAAYLEQLIYTDILFADLVNRILQQSEVPPIIIVQGDHGPSWVGPDTEKLFDFNMTTRLPILNAYHFPYGGDTVLYPDISPVNSFRMLLNYYFGTDLEKLDDYSNHKFQRIDNLSMP